MIPWKITADELLARYNTGQRDFPGIDLKGANLTGMDLSGINLSNSTLHWVIIDNTNFSNSTLENIRIENTCVIDSDFRNANFTGSRVMPNTFVSTNLEGANFRNTHLFFTKFINCNLLNADLTNIRRISSSRNQRVIFCQTVMPDGTIGNDSRIIDASELIRLYDEGQRLFEYIVLYNTDLRGIELNEIRMFWCTFVNVDMRGFISKNSRWESTLINVDLRESQWNNTHFFGTKLLHTDLRRANLFQATLECVELTGSNLEGIRRDFIGGEKGGPSCFQTTWCEGTFIADADIFCTIGPRATLADF